ncbi:MAG: extracellular solute-binding protein [Planctomycetes bacterium]|nr:extracellular solute-binding protein [Planctomycetota bacterium]
MNFFGKYAQDSATRSCATRLALLLAAALGACDQAPPTPTVVVYTSVDQTFARRVLHRFQEQTGIRVDALYDAEAGKTTGFLRRLKREAVQPRCDVWWSSEVFGTIELARQDIFTAYRSPAADDIPEGWKDDELRWTGVAARARVLAFDTRKWKKADLPQTWRELATSEHLSGLAIANPRFGTTRGHLAAMFAYWPEPAGREFLERLRTERATVADGNAHAVRLVASGAVDFCLTDTDDVWVAQRRGDPIGLVYPRLEPNGPVVWIPCSVALVRGGPHAENGRKLVDYLLSAAVERALAESDSRNVPLRRKLREELTPNSPAPEPIDFERVADALPAAMKAARDILLR